MAKGLSSDCEVEYKPRVYLDFKDKEEAEEFLKDGVGTKVTVVLQGKLSSIRLDDDGTASIAIEAPEIERIDNDKFSQLADD